MDEWQPQNNLFSICLWWFLISNHVPCIFYATFESIALNTVSVPSLYQCRWFVIEAHLFTWQFCDWCTVFFWCVFVRSMEQMSIFCLNNTFLPNFHTRFVAWIWNVQSKLLPSNRFKSFFSLSESVRVCFFWSSWIAGLLCTIANDLVGWLSWKIWELAKTARISGAKNGTLVWIWR